MDNDKSKKPRIKSGGLDDSEKSSELGGQGSDNDMRAEVDLNAISGSAGILKAESITEGNKQLQPEDAKGDQGEKDEPVAEWD